MTACAEETEELVEAVKRVFEREGVDCSCGDDALARAVLAAIAEKSSWARLHEIAERAMADSGPLTRISITAGSVMPNSPPLSSALRKGRGCWRNPRWNLKNAQT